MMQCEICGSNEDVKRVGTNKFWCKKCTKKELDVAMELLKKEEPNIDAVILEVTSI